LIYIKSHFSYRDALLGIGAVGGSFKEEPGYLRLIGIGFSELRMTYITEII
jgi:hypothetical protein